MSDLQLIIDNQVWDGWKSARVRRSIRQAADSFELSLTDRWFGNPKARPIRSDSPCRIAIDGETVITGYVYDVTPDYDHQDHYITVTGFSKAKDLVDCSIVGKQFRNRSLLQIATELAKPFGISVLSDIAEVTKPFHKVSLEAGQSIFSFLEELCRIRGVRMVSTPRGDIALIQTGSEKISTPLVLGENILKASGRNSSEFRFSEYKVLGQSAGTDDWYGTQAAHVEAVERDGSTRYRPHTLLADGPANKTDCQARAITEKNRRYGESRSIRYTVQGWHHANGLWLPNYMVDIDDSYQNIKNTWLIPSVDYVIDENGSFTEIEVSPKEAFNLSPLPEPKLVNGGW